MDFQHWKSLAVALLLNLFKKRLSLYSYDQLFHHLGWAFNVVTGKDEANWLVLVTWPVVRLRHSEKLKCFYLDAARTRLEKTSAVCGIILLAWAVPRHGFSLDESNVLRWMCSCQSPHRCGCLLYFAIIDYSLCLGIYDPNKNFHRILPTEQVSNKSATFVLTNWGKKHYNKSRYQWWLNLKIG